MIFGGLCVKSAHWIFSDANLALKLTAAFTAVRLRQRSVHNLTRLFVQFLQFDNFFFFSVHFDVI